MTKMTGAEYKAFITSDWGHPEAWWDDTSFKLNGVEVDEIDDDDIPADAKVEILSGVVIVGDKSYAAKSFAKTWQKKQTVKSVVLNVEIARFEEFKAAIAGLSFVKIV